MFEEQNYLNFENRLNFDQTRVGRHWKMVWLLDTPRDIEKLVWLNTGHVPFRFRTRGKTKSVDTWQRWT